MRVSFFTSWDTACGIASYSKYFKDALERLGLMIDVVPAGRETTLAGFIKLGKLMNNADIVHIQHEYSFFGSKRLPQAVFFCFFLRQIKVPVVITLHELMLPSTGRLYQFRRFALFFMQRHMFSRAALILVHDNTQRETLLSMGIKNERVALFPHPIPEIKEPHDSNKKCKDLFGVSTKNVFTIFGFVYERKGYDLALNAIRDMKDSVLIIAGGENQNDKSGYYQRLKGKIRDLELQDRVLITGFMPENDIHKVMGATDVVLAPYIDMYGSGSLSLSAAYHKPIIASDIEPMRDLKKMGMGLILFKSGDVTNLKDNMLAILKNEPAKAELVRSTNQYARDFSYDSSAIRLVEIYKKLIGK